MRFEIRRLHDEFHVTTVYVTHDQAEAMVTSDRIAVMNHGRIEQVDQPRALYNQPKTRFVAGFIGRTNFIEGLSDGQQIAFDGFALPRAGIRTRCACRQQGGVFGPPAQHAAFRDPSCRARRLRPGRGCRASSARFLASTGITWYDRARAR